MLDKISNTSSKLQYTEEQIPSFKQLKIEPIDFRNVQAQTIYQTTNKNIDSSVFSFNNQDMQQTRSDNISAFRKVDQKGTVINQQHNR